MHRRTAAFLAGYSERWRASRFGYPLGRDERAELLARLATGLRACLESSR